MKVAYSNLEELQTRDVKEKLDAFFAPLDELERSLHRQESSSQGWSAAVDDVARAMDGVSLQINDAVVGLQSWGQAWRNLRNVALQVLSDIISKMFIAAALKSVLGFLGGAIGGPIGGFLDKVAGKIKAGGGGTFVTKGPTQLTVGDNPGGVELVNVVPLSGVGRTSVSDSAMAAAGGGTLLAGARAMLGGGDVFNFSYAFSGGVSREEILGLLPTMVEASKNAVLDAKRRRRDGFR